MFFYLIFHTFRQLLENKENLLYQHILGLPLWNQSLPPPYISQRYPLAVDFTTTDLGLTLDTSPFSFEYSNDIWTAVADVLDESTTRLFQ